MIFSLQDDYRRTILELDEKEFISLRLCCVEIRNHYVSSSPVIEHPQNSGCRKSKSKDKSKQKQGNGGGAGAGEKRRGTLPSEFPCFCLLLLCRCPGFLTMITGLYHTHLNKRPP